MEKMKDLKDLLTHEIQDLYSAEEQIIKAMPLMIEKSKNAELEKALKEHLRITEVQKNRLDEVKRLLKASSAELPGAEEERKGDPGEDESGGEEKKGFLSGLFGGSDGSQVCRGMMGLIEEGQKVMNENMSPEVLDAAIIASAQKIEHYEICGYGTARAFALELNLREVAELLEQTLEEEYNADDLLTELAVGKLNEVAEGRRSRRSGRGNNSGRRSGNNSRTTKKAAPKKAAAKKAAPAKKAAAKKAAPRKAAPKKAAPKKAAAKKAAPKKAVGKASSGRGSNKSSKAASTRNAKSGGRAGNSQRGSRGR